MKNEMIIERGYSKAIFSAERNGRKFFLANNATARNTHTHTHTEFRN
jgi:hypothetical protein